MSIDANLPPRCAARFRPEALLGHGGCGQVWRAWQVDLARPVAVKVLLPDVLELPEAAGRFRDEARIGASLNHPHLVKVFDHDVEDGVAWIAYELVEGPTVQRLLADGPRVPRDALDVARQVALALEELHAHGIIHRDIKPSNVMQSAPDHYKVADLGISKWSRSDRSRTASGVVLGTPGYVPPELLSGSSCTMQGDVYATGVLLFQMLTSRHPFDYNLVLELQAHAQDALPVPGALAAGIPPSTDRLVQRLMATDPRARPSGGRELRLAIEEELEILARPPSRGPARAREGGAPARTLRLPAAPPSRARPKLAPALGVLAAALLATFAATRPAGRRVVPPPAPDAPPAAAPAVPPSREELARLAARLEGLGQARQQRMPEYQQIWDMALGLDQDIDGAVRLATRHRELNRADLRVLEGMLEPLSCAAEGARPDEGEPIALLVRACAELAVTHLRTTRIERMLDETFRAARLTGGHSLSALLGAQAAGRCRATAADLDAVRGFLRAAVRGVAHVATAPLAPGDTLGPRFLAQLYWVGETVRAFSWEAGLARALADGVSRDFRRPLAAVPGVGFAATFASAAERSWDLGVETDPARYARGLELQLHNFERLAGLRSGWTLPLQTLLDELHRTGPGPAAAAPVLRPR